MKGCVKLIVNSVKNMKTEIKNKKSIYDMIYRHNEKIDIILEERRQININDKRDNYLFYKKNMLFSNTLMETKTIIDQYKANNITLKTVYLIADPPLLNSYNNFKIDEWQYNTYINTVHLFNITDYILDDMIEKKNGTIVFIIPENKNVKSTEKINQQDTIEYSLLNNIYYWNMRKLINKYSMNNIKFYMITENYIPCNIKTTVKSLEEAITLIETPEYISNNLYNPIIIKQ